MAHQITNPHNDLDVMECLTKFREPLIRQIITSLHISMCTRGLDAGCGLGFFTHLLARQTGMNGHVTGLDISKELITLARKEYANPYVDFATGDINHLSFEPATFDWIWSMDTLWPGSPENGCPFTSPDPVMKSFYRLLKPGGRLFLLFWSGQKLLPGHPLLEARLNATVPANAPFTPDMDPYLHILNCKHWFQNAGYDEIESITFVRNVCSPLCDNSKKALAILYRMLWGNSREELPEDIREQYFRFCIPGSAAFIPDQPHFCGFYTYTLFMGTKPK